MNDFKFRGNINKLFWRVIFTTFSLLPVYGLAQIKTVWALGDGEKVFQNELNHPDKIKNFIWDGRTIRLKGLYNEVLAFQVIVESGSQGAETVELSVDAPLHKLSGKAIGSSTLKYGTGGTVEIFSQHYLNVQDPTLPNWFYGSTTSAPKEMTGWIPDALIPTNALPNHEGFPIKIAPNSNQVFG